MPIRDMDELAPATRDVVQDYLNALEAGFCGITRDVAADALDDVRGYLFERLSAGSSAEDAHAAIGELGEPDEYAARLCTEVRRQLDEDDSTPTRDLAEPQGRILGMPYDVKAPTAGNLQSRMWNPDDPRIFTPRLIGIGWTINFAAVAIRLGIIRPDDEDEPFASVPEPALWGALFVPIVMCGAVVVSIALMWPVLPEQVAVHWGFDGQPDGFASPPVALLPMIAIAVLPTGYAIWTFVKGRSKAARAVTTAFTSMFVAIAAGLTFATLAGAAEWALWWAWPWLMIAAAFGVPFAILLGLSRIGYAREVRRDLGAHRS